MDGLTEKQLEELVTHQDQVKIRILGTVRPSGRCSFEG